MAQRDKTIAQVVSAASLRFEKRVTIMRSQVREYKAVIDGKDTEYDKLYITFMVDDDTDDDDFLGGGTKTLMLGARDDPAYASLLHVSRGTTGTMTFSVSEQITAETTDSEGNRGTGSHIVGLTIESFSPDKKE